MVCGSTPRSRAKISSTRGPQKPPWQRPIPGLQRRLTPSTETGGMGECSASRISPSVTVSQRQITRPYAGLRLTSSSRSFEDISRNRTRWRVSSNTGFCCSASPAFCSRRTASLAMAGALVSPGDLMPAKLMRPGASLLSPTIKSG
ncbi:hypothetical protein SDC9_180690 [bioreactor metagenome]|uniref:Uncharacterized protein n=1 Tax=bioreactor metagenome TaxID=1076179 RepID=A0A645H3Z7_9ZZZZ